MSDGSTAAEHLPFDFTCRRSGNCCARPGGMVRVSADEAAAIAAHLGLSEAGFRARYVDVDGLRLRDGLGGRCVFLEDGRQASCSIHPVRPAKCRSWPFWPELLESAELLAEARRSCPGIVERSGSGDADR